MATNTTITSQEKREIAHKYTVDEMTQTDLASEYLVSRRTIQRVLQEMGVLKYNEKQPRYVTEEEEAILSRVKRRGLTSMSLERLMENNGVTKDTVQRFLTQLEPVELADTLYVVGYLKVQQLARQHKAANEQLEQEGSVANE